MVTQSFIVNVQPQLCSCILSFVGSGSAALEAACRTQQAAFGGGVYPAGLCGPSRWLEEAQSPTPCSRGCLCPQYELCPQDQIETPSSLHWQPSSHSASVGQEFWPEIFLEKTQVW